MYKFYSTTVGANDVYKYCIISVVVDVPFFVT